MERQNEAGWQIVETEIVIETPHLRLRRDRIRLPGGATIGDYYVRESRGFCVVFALTPDERVVLVRQYKHGIGATLLELPAGGLDAGETPTECARRELAEETGYVAVSDDLELVGTFVFDPTSSTTLYHVFVGRNARPSVATKFDATEDIAVELAPIDDVRRFCRDGTIKVGVHMGSIYYVLDRLGRL